MPSQHSRTPLAKRILLGLAVTLLASCRLVITTDDTGYIVSTSGNMDCQAASCIYPIEELVLETFVAIPADGYRFVRWNGVCDQYVTEVCNAAFAPPDPDPGVPVDVYLSAVFEPLSTTRLWYRDADGDQYGNPGVSLVAATPPAGYVINYHDCDDTDPGTYPGSTELQDGKDNNCNGSVDEGFRYFRDVDGDKFGDPDNFVPAGGSRPAGYARNGRDCNDTDSAINPDAVELTDGRDNNCDGNVDEVDGVYYRDVDGDGYGDTNDSIESPSPVSGYVRQASDCDDNNDAISPAAEEIFDGVDNNCDGRVDEGFAPRTFYRDADGDGFGDPADSVQALERPQGYIRNGTDNCPDIYNPTQADVDGDGLGDACDPVNNSGGGTCTVSAQAQAMLDAVNSFRAQTRDCGSSGTFPAAPALSWNCKLESAALTHSIDMAQNNFFSHTGSDGSTVGARASRAGYSWTALGENIAAGGSLTTAGAAVQAWTTSPPHCANMMSPIFVHLGAATASNSGSTYINYWTQVFGKSN